MSTSPAPVVSVRGLRKVYPGRAGGPDVVAIADANFDLAAGRTLGVIGESGSGKSTLARSILGLSPVDAGTIRVLGTSLRDAGDLTLRQLRAQMQIVFQEPQEALSPRMRVGDAIAEPLRIHTRMRGAELRQRVGELLEHVMLDPALAGRYPHELSGGQQQRVNIARAVATEPKLVVLDEPTASLDVSVRAGILSLLARLQQELSLTYVLISHDLPTIRAMCDEVMVMYRGAVVEYGPAERVLTAPEHPYTAYLLASDLPLDPDVDLAPLPEWRPEAARTDPDQTALIARRTA